MCNFKIDQLVDDPIHNHDHDHGQKALLKEEPELISESEADTLAGEPPPCAGGHGRDFCQDCPQCVAIIDYKDAQAARRGGRDGQDK